MQSPTIYTKILALSQTRYYCRASGLVKFFLSPISAIKWQFNLIGHFAGHAKCPRRMFLNGFSILAFIFGL